MSRCAEPKARLKATKINSLPFPPPPFFLPLRPVVVVGHTSCGGVLASLGCAKDPATPLPSPELSRFLKPLVGLCSSVRSEMGLKDGEEPSEEMQADLLRKATEANVKAQVANVAASKIIQANWAGKNSAFPGQSKYKIKVHG